MRQSVCIFLGILMLVLVGCSNETVEEQENVIEAQRRTLEQLDQQI